ncbi:hypothetical protein BpHYR1_010460 [Brachionus plicatilis]|uniref:Uncharacterized protein n=1 Tax=Brachionus plicatilis TaxID=10195 RepID=A0A3M7SLC7_BRAPC|nr:hypothetical protein BpHYR1_010460 [Brachionus plicatilis]
MITEFLVNKILFLMGKNRYCFFNFFFKNILNDKIYLKHNFIRVSESHNPSPGFKILNTEEEL